MHRITHAGRSNWKRASRVLAFAGLVTAGFVTGALAGCSDNATGNAAGGNATATTPATGNATGNVGAVAAKGPLTVLLSPRSGKRVGYVGYELVATDEIPAALPADAGRLTVTGDAVVNGDSSFTPTQMAAGGGATRMNINAANTRVIRLEVHLDQAKSLIGKIHAKAAKLDGIWLQAGSEMYSPFGYVMITATGEAKVHASDLLDVVRAMELPFDDMEDPDRLYLYFACPPGAKITKLSLGAATHQALPTFTVPASGS